MSVPGGTVGRVGFSNTGYLGVPVNQDIYANSFWIKGNYVGTVTVSLYGPSGRAYGSKDIIVKSNSSAFTYYETTFTSTQSYESDNAWRLTFDGAQVAGSALNFGLVQLFPTTYHARLVIV